MSAEIELKLTLPPKALLQAQRLPWLRRLARERLSRREMSTVYFDTSTGMLRRHDLTLRVRKSGPQRVQTIKTGESGGPLERGEWEQAIASNRPDLKLAKGTPLARLAGGKLDRKLQPVFRTEVRRITMDLSVRGSRVELALDRGTIVAARKREPICELELELKSGRPADLVALARRLLRTLPLAFAGATKAERGFLLRAGESDAPRRATPLALRPSQPSREAFARIGLSCLAHIAGNQRAVVAGHAEGIHQMRVGVRRLRAAISLFGDMIAGKATERIKVELKWLAAELGPARDLEVLIEEAVGPLHRDNPDEPEIGVLEADLRHERRERLAHARAAVQSERCRTLLVEAALWLLDGAWRGPAGAPNRRARRDRKIAAAAAAILDRRTSKLVKKSKRLDRLGARERHKLRIAAKKLRYGCGFFASLFGHPKRQQRFEQALKRLQASLGALNDISVRARKAHRLAPQAKPSRRRTQEAYAMGFLSGREKRKVRALEDEAMRARAALARQKPFW